MPNDLTRTLLEIAVSAAGRPELAPRPVWTTCLACDGHGWVEVEDDWPVGSYNTATLEDDSYLASRTVREDCEACAGEGEIPRCSVCAGEWDPPNHDRDCVLGG